MHSAAHVLSRAGGDPLGPLLGTNLLTKWQLNAIAVAVLVLAAAAYLTGVALVPGAMPAGDGRCGARASFLAGLAVCAFATCGSIAVYDQVLFTAHMAGHLALVMVAPAFLVGGPSARPGARRRAADAPRADPARRAAAASCRCCSPRRSRWRRTRPSSSAAHLTGADGRRSCATPGPVRSSTSVYVLAGMQFFVLVIGAEPIRWRLATPARWLLLAVAMAVDTFTGIVLMQGTHAVAMSRIPAWPSIRCPTRAPAARSCGSAATRSWS